MPNYEVNYFYASFILALIQKPIDFINTILHDSDFPLFFKLLFWKFFFLNSLPSPLHHQYNSLRHFLEFFGKKISENLSLLSNSQKYLHNSVFHSIFYPLFSVNRMPLDYRCPQPYEKTVPYSSGSENHTQTWVLNQWSLSLSWTAI